MRKFIILVAAVALSTPLASCGESVPKPTLSVLTANMANAADVGGFNWKDRIDRFALAINRDRPVADIISMTESAGLWHCSVGPYTGAKDYDLVDRLIWRLHQVTGVSYRVAYLVGAAGAIKNSFGTPHCWYYSGDTLLYNPSRLRNLTPGDVAGRPQERHDGPLVGFQVRRGLPLCDRGSSLEPLATLIDGPPQTDRCNLETPSGPAWIQLDRNRSGDHTLVASLARFALADVPDSSFDVVTTHPQAGEEDDHGGPINDFIAALTGPSYRTSNPLFPVVVLGDFNKFVDEPWPKQTTQVFRSPPPDVMAVAVGSGVGLQPTHGLSVDSKTTLPSQEPCRPEVEGGPLTEGDFSDHCGLLVRFSGN
jgi:hypothetical protein